MAIYRTSNWEFQFFRVVLLCQDLELGSFLFCDIRSRIHKGLPRPTRQHIGQSLLVNMVIELPIRREMCTRLCAIQFISQNMLVQLFIASFGDFNIWGCRL